MIVIFSYSDAGEKLANNLAPKLNAMAYRSGKTEFVIKEFLRDNWLDLEGIIFICSTGIAVRMISDFLVSKGVDPAVVVIDDTGKYVVSLLSGHLGGANALTTEIAELIGAHPVITTSTDNHGIEGVDDFARKNRYEISDIKKILPMAKLMLSGKRIGIYSKYKVFPNYDNLIEVDSFEVTDLDGLIVVSPHVEEKLDLPYIWLYPKVINIGIGCRKGIESNKIIDLIESKLSELGLSPKSISGLGTVEAKRYEAGILDTAKHFRRELTIFSNEEIRSVEELFEKSEFVKRSIGVYNVSAPSAHLLGGRMIVEKFKADGITLSITMEE